MLKIGIDAQSIIGNRSGVGQYTFELLSALERIKPCDVRLKSVFFSFLKNRGLDLPEHDGFAHCPVKFLPGRVMFKWWQYVPVPFYDWLCGRCDVFHFPNFISRPVCGGKTVITVHDVGYLRFPGFVEPKNLVFLRRNLVKSIKRADAVLCVSEFTRREVLELFDVKPEKVFAAPLGVNSNVAKTVSQQAQAQIKQALSLPEKYILAVSTIEPRKNFKGLFRAFAKVRKDLEGAKLVIAGGNGWLFDDIYHEVQKLGIEDDVVFCGYVSDEQLCVLYENALFLAFMSHYEGFGLPVLEAMKRKVAVLCSTAGSLPEVAGDAALSCDPKDYDTMGKHISALTHDGDLRQKLIAAGTDRVKKFSWDKTAEQTLNVYRQVAGK